jgi:hypothetical protein
MPKVHQRKGNFYKIRKDLNSLEKKIKKRRRRIPDVDMNREYKRRFLRQNEKLINFRSLDDDGHVYLRASPKIFFIPAYIDQIKGEAFYFKLLVENVPFRHVDELLVDMNGNEHETFMQAALANKLVLSENKVAKDLKTGNNMLYYLNRLSKGELILSEPQLQELIFRCAKTISESRNPGADISLKLLAKDVENYFPKFSRHMNFAITKDNLTDPVGDEGRLREQKLNIRDRILKEMFGYFGTESNINDLLRQLNPANFKHLIGKKAFDEQLKRIQKFHSMYKNRFSPDQQLAVRKILKGMYSTDSRCHYIAAPAGFGKTDLILNLVELFEKGLGLEVIVTAPTATAARLINGETVHSSFRIHPMNFNEHITPSSFRGGEIRKSEVIIVDECGMLTKELLEKIDAA